MDKCYRPIIHFTPSNGWINDPNGLMYDEFNDTYHLFAQYSKGIDNNGIYGWMHATSSDLIHWVEKDVPILTNSKGDAWSGGGVVDYNNTSHLFSDTVPPGSRMICFVTYQSSNPKIGILYTLDGGDTWKEYDDFVIKNENNKYSSEFRDPKVIWYEEGNKWLLIVGGFTTIKLFSSSNLLAWEYESEILDVNGNTVNSECPDIYKIYLNNNKDNIKYIVSTGGTSYIVGNLSIINNMITFIGEQEVKKMFLGPNLWTCKGELYATQSFYNDKYNRLILMSWVVDRTASRFNNKSWNGAESIPLEARLISKENEMILNLYPVKELDDNRVLINEGVINNGLIKNDSLYFDLELEIRESDYFELSFNDTLISYSSNSLSYSYDDVKFEFNEIKNINKLRIVVDSYITEIFINDGEYNIHGMNFNNNNLNIKIVGNTLLSYHLYKIKQKRQN